MLMDSMSVRNEGFIEVLKSYPTEQVGELMQYHLANGGLSRYVKFRYFFEQILNERITDEEVNRLAQEFSEIMLTKLKDPSLLISDAIDFVKSYHKQHAMHVVSGSDQKELREICAAVGIDQFFITIGGSPTPKTQLVKDVLNQYGYSNQNCVLIGDSVNDFDAAQINGVRFFGYNNVKLKGLGEDYIEKFSAFDIR